MPCSVGVLAGVGTAPLGLHPLGAMFALLAGLQLAGLLGGLFGVPLAGVSWVLLGAGYRNAAAEPPAP